MARRLLLSSVRWVVSALPLALIVVTYTRVFTVNATTAAVTFLMLILLLAAYFGLRYAVATSVAAALCFNYYFLPPVNSFSIAGRQDWLAMFSFLATALVGSNLSDRVHQQAERAERSRAELECLYDFGQRLLATGTTAELVRTVPMSVVAAFRAYAAVLYLVEGDSVFLAGPEEQGEPVPRERLREAVHGHAVRLSAHTALLPVSVGVRPIGAVYVESRPDEALPALETLEAMSALIAISIERTGAVDKLARSDAARESEQLRSALLDAVTHDLRTPLTSIKAAVTALFNEGKLTTTLAPEQRAELLSIIDEETDRLNLLIAQATEMAALDAHQVRLALAPCAVAVLVEDAVETCRGLLGSRDVRLQVPADLPGVSADSVLIRKVLVHLVENAAKYSSPGAPITIAAAVAAGGKVTVSVTDCGPGIEPDEQQRVFEKFYRGRNQRYRAPGTGMGLAICRSIMEAHAGTIALESRKGEGSTFTLTLPTFPVAK